MKKPTQIVTAGRPHLRQSHPVNQAVERASTYLFPTYEDFISGNQPVNYGRHGGPNHRNLEEAVTILEGGFDTILTSSGLQACILPILAFVEEGDHILMTDTTYGPTRSFCDTFLKRMGVATTYYDPMIGEGVADLMTPKTKVVFAESPGSLTFEVQDLPAIADAAHAGGAKLIVDNTWGAGYFLKPLSLGADVSVQAATKYIVGHADCLIGTISSRNEECARAIEKTRRYLGIHTSADDAWLALRGLRTLTARLAVHEEAGLKLARWLAKRPEVDKLLHPAFKSCPGHALWKRDFSGAASLFSVILKPVGPAGERAFFNALKLFGLGYSWGGYESLCIPVRPEQSRTATTWEEDGPVFRFHVGLEDIDDLTNDLENAFAAMAAAKEADG